MKGIKKIIDSVKTDSKDSEYSPFRMKTAILNDMKRIANAEEVTYPGRLVHEVLANFIKEYDESKSNK